MMRKLWVVFIAALFACSYGGKRMRVDILNPAADLYDKGMSAYNMGDMERAIQYFKDIVDYYPKNDLADDALLMLAQCYEEQGDLYSALSYYKLFLYRFPKDKRCDLVMRKVDELEKKLGLKKKKEGGHGGS